MMCAVGGRGLAPCCGAQRGNHSNINNNGDAVSGGCVPLLPPRSDREEEEKGL